MKIAAGASTYFYLSMRLYSFFVRLSTSYPTPKNKFIKTEKNFLTPWAVTDWPTAKIFFASGPARGRASLDKLIFWRFTGVPKAGQEKDPVPVTPGR